VAVANHLVLLGPQVFLNLAAVKKEYPLDKVIEFFALSGRCLNSFSQLDIAYIFQEKLRSDDPAELPEGKIERIPNTAFAQSPGNGRGEDLAPLDGNRDA
jgi:hypothetical protein